VEAKWSLFILKGYKGVKCMKKKENIYKKTKRQKKCNRNKV